ncbi:unannotated protein [freshwater metagenome]|uniref:Unannotated protein n=1 Tax=freshwater metagenome TaxID=449393 RepID=A0A6J7BTX6_9ZZZZ
MLKNWIEDLPAQFHFLVTWEQRRIAEEHIEDEPLVRLRARFGEGISVGEVHVDVAYLHRCAGHLRSESHGDPFVGLNPHDKCVLP